MWIATLASDNSDYFAPCMLFIFGIVVAIFATINHFREKKKLEKLTYKERQELERIQRQFEEDKERGTLNAAMVCPHCQTKGVVRTKKIKQKQGISGGKATAALLTGGASLVLVGLSKKTDVTQAECENCHCQWLF